MTSADERTVRDIARGFVKWGWFMSFVDAPDWSSIPAPKDDGATRHLAGAKLASVPLRATDGSMVDLSALKGRTIIYVYPRTGRPDIANPPG